MKYRRFSQVHELKLCPRCRSSVDVIAIMYGLPNDRGWAAQEAGHIVLGGCIIHLDSPRLYCKRCSLSFDRPDPELADGANCPADS
jgi:hypothetical protein